MNMTYFIAAIISIAVQSSQQLEYDPTTTSEKVIVTDLEFTYGDDNVVPVRIYMPESDSPSPIILNSHGLGGSRENSSYLGNHWAGRGYAVVFMQHVGSDEAVWKDTNRWDRLRKLKSAITPKTFNRRMADVPATLDQLQKWNSPGGKFAGKFDLERIGMCGHSYGAVTTQALSGQSYNRRGQAFTDVRIKAALPMSPSPPRHGNDGDTFGKVEIPWLLMTGTKDESIVASTTAEDRQKVFQQLPESGHAYHLVLNDAKHMAFSDRTLTNESHRNKNHHKAILALSSAFWDTYLRGDEAAKKWLRGENAKSVLESKDKWEKK
jgi:predicted dienelactone hydrolase